MKLMGSLVNCGTVIIGTLCGLLFKKGIPEKIEKMIMQAIGLCVLCIGISGLSDCENTIVLIVSMVIGTAIGTAVDLDRRMNAIGAVAEKKFASKSKKSSSGFSEGFVSATLIFCVGAMSVVGSLSSGLKYEHTTLYSKAVLDGIVSIILASTYGIGVMFSIIPILIYQGGIALLASLLSPVLTTVIINEMSAAGSLLILALSLNMLKITDIKIMNMLPAIFLPILIYQLPIF